MPGDRTTEADHAFRGARVAINEIAETIDDLLLRERFRDRTGARLPVEPPFENRLVSVTTLSPRELDVLRFLVEGKSDREIGVALYISTCSVMRHVTGILNKRGVSYMATTRPTTQTLIILRQLGGAIGQIPDDATAYGHHRAAYNPSVDATRDDPADDSRMISWTREACQDMRDRTGGGIYLNFAGLGEENEELARAGYGNNSDRLREIKARYDPTNLFRGTFNIAP